MVNLTKKEDMTLISKIVKRGYPLMSDCYRSMFDMILDLTCVNDHTPLKLNDLLVSDDQNFNHDIIGICKNLNRSTKKLDNCFIPRYTK